MPGAVSGAATKTHYYSSSQQFCMVRIISFLEMREEWASSINDLPKATTEPGKGEGTFIIKNPLCSSCFVYFFFHVILTATLGGSCDL